MKSIIKNISKITAAFLLLLTLSCTEKEVREYDANGEIIRKGIVGLAQINIDLNLNFGETKMPSKAASVNLDDFTVTIVDKATDKVVEQWKKSAMPTSIKLRIGNYRMDVNYPKNPIDGAWAQPSYGGSQDFIIQEGKTTNIAPIECKPTNMQVSVNFAPEFTEQMSEYYALVFGGKSQRLTFAKDEMRSGYYNPGSLVVQITGKFLDGTTVQPKTVTISEGKAADHHIINVTSTFTGNGVPSISVDLTTNEKKVDIKVDDDDIIYNPEPNPEPDPKPDPDPDPSPVKPTVTGIGFDIRSVMNHKFGATKSVDITVKAPNKGIAELKVIIDSKSLSELLQAQGIPESFDLANLNSTLKDVFIGLGLIDDKSIKGKEVYTFSIGAFMQLLPVDTHTFAIKVKDGAGGSVTESLVVKVTE